MSGSALKPSITFPLGIGFLLLFTCFPIALAFGASTIVVRVMVLCAAVVAATIWVEYTYPATALADFQLGLVWGLSLACGLMFLVSLFILSLPAVILIAVGLVKFLFERARAGLPFSLPLFALGSCTMPLIFWLAFF